MTLRYFLPSMSTKRTVEVIVEKNEQKKLKRRRMRSRKKRIIWAKEAMKHGESKH